MKSDKLEGTYTVIKNSVEPVKSKKYTPVQIRILTALRKGSFSQYQLHKIVHVGGMGNISHALNILIDDGDISVKRCECCETTKKYSLSKAYLNRKLD